MNQRPHPYQGCALPTELVAHNCSQLTKRKGFADGGTVNGVHLIFFHRKEVIQPQVPLRLPCYDFIPITSPTLGHCLLAVNSCTSGRTGFHDVTGGVYKARERIHGVIADTPLLAIPTSWSRVADSNPNWAWFCGLAQPRGVASHCTKHCSTCAALVVRAILT